MKAHIGWKIGQKKTPMIADDYPPLVQELIQAPRPSIGERKVSNRRASAASF